MGSPPWHVDELQTTVGTGHRVAVWRTGRSGPGNDAPAALVAPGFARRMPEMALAAMYLAEAGFIVYRCDYVDHSGLSEDDIFDFTMTSMYDTQGATLDLVMQREGRNAVVVAASLANRAAVRLAARDEPVTAVIGLAGVVDSRFTLNRVFGKDYATYQLDDLPEYVVFENSRIRARNWCSDWQAGGWITIEGTAEELRHVSCPVVNFCGSDDDLVAITDVQWAFEVGNAGPRRLIELPVEHEMSNDPVAGLTLMHEVVREALACAGHGDGTDTPEPSLKQIAEQVSFERRFEAEAATRAADRRERRPLAEAVKHEAEKSPSGENCT